MAESSEVSFGGQVCRSSALQWSVCSTIYALRGRRSIHKRHSSWTVTEILFLFQMAPSGGNLGSFPFYDRVEQWWNRFLTSVAMVGGSFPLQQRLLLMHHTCSVVTYHPSWIQSGLVKIATYLLGLPFQTILRQSHSAIFLERLDESSSVQWPGLLSGDLAVSILM